MTNPDAGNGNGGPGRSRRPGVADLSTFRGRTTRFGAPVLPPGWRPDRDTEVDTVQIDLVATPVDPPIVVPAWAPAPAPPAPDASVVPARTAGAEIRVIRRLRPWSVWKLTLAYGVCMVAVFATAGAILWAIAAAIGVVGNIEGFIEDLGFDDFSFDGSEMLTAFVLGGLLAALAASVMATILAVMFNLLSGLTGGLETELGPKAVKARVRRRQVRKAAKAERKAERKAARQGRGRRRRGAVAAEAVEVARRNGEPDLDLTEEAGAGVEVDHFQRVLDDLLADPPPPGDGEASG